MTGAFIIEEWLGCLDWFDGFTRLPNPLWCGRLAHDEEASIFPKVFVLSVGSKKKQEKQSILRSHNQGETENAIYEGKFALTKQLYLPNAKFGSDVE